MKKRLTSLFFALLLTMISVMAMGCASDLPPNSGTGSSNLSGGESSSIEDSSSNLSDGESSSVEDSSSDSSDGESSSIEDDGSSEEENSSSEKKDDLESDEYENDGGWMN